MKAYSFEGRDQGYAVGRREMLATDMRAEAFEAEELAANAFEMGDVKEGRYWSMRAGRYNKLAAHREHLAARAFDNLTATLSLSRESRLKIAEELDASGHPRAQWAAFILRDPRRA